MPDKEPPLWNPNSIILYWWTSTKPDSEQAYYIDFNSRVYPTDKISDPGSNVRIIERRKQLGFTLGSRYSLRLERKFFRQYFDRHLVLNLLNGYLQHFSLATFA
jgi:hypothetical protein